MKDKSFATNEEHKKDQNQKEDGCLLKKFDV